MDNNIIAEMLKIEQDAKDRLAEAEQKKAAAIADAEEEKERIIRDKLRAAEEEKDKLYSDERKKTESRLAEIEKSKNDAIKRLDDIYEKSHSDWENIFFNAVIGG